MILENLLAIFVFVFLIYLTLNRLGFWQRLVQEGKELVEALKVIIKEFWEALRHA